MGHLEKNSVVKLTDNKFYLVLETMTIDNMNYIYVIEKDNPMNLKFYKEVLVGNQIALNIVEDKDELDRIMKEFYQKMRKNIQKNNGVH